MHPFRLGRVTRIFTSWETKKMKANFSILLARRLFPETENTIITEEVKKFPDGK